MGLSDQLRLAQQDCSAAHQHLHEKDGELLKLQSQHSELQQASRALQAELVAARDRLAVLEADLPMLQQDVLQLSSENTRLHIELEECQAAVQQLREQLGAARKEAKKAGEESKRQLRNLAAKKEELEHRAEALSAQLASVQQDFYVLSARVQQQDEENDQLQVGLGLTPSLQCPTDPLTLWCLKASWRCLNKPGGAQVQRSASSRSTFSAGVAWSSVGCTGQALGSDARREGQPGG